ALMTIEGEFDDISGLGQTRAAHTLCTSIPERDRAHLTVPAGHYGIFSGRRWREQVDPQVRDFIASCANGRPGPPPGRGRRGPRPRRRQGGRGRPLSGRFTSGPSVRLSGMSDVKPRLQAVPPARPASGQAEALVRDFHQSLIRMLQARLGSREDAHEVAQEAYARLLNLGDDKAISFHSAYLFRIAHNLATDRLRRRAHMEQPAEDYIGGRPDPAMDPERSAAAAQIVARLPALL